MPIDTSMYQNMKLPDFVGAYREGKQWRQEQDKLKKAQDLEDAKKGAITLGPDGKMSINAEGLKKVAEVSPDAGYQMQRQFAQDQDADSKTKYESELRHADVLSRSLSGVNPQNYAQERQKLIAGGFASENELPAYYDKNFIDAAHAKTLSYKEQLDKQMQERQLEDRAADRREARDERRFQAGIKMDEQKQALQTPYGLANSVDDAKQLKEAHESKKNFDNKIQEMIDLRTNAGGGETLDREAVNRGKQLSKDLLLEYKNMAKLGVLSKSDEDIINAIIPKDPLAYNSPLEYLQGQDSILNNLKKFKGDSDKDFANRVATRTRAGLAAGDGKEADVESYAKSHGISYEQAASVKRSRLGQTAGR